MKFDMKKPCDNCPFRKSEKAVRFRTKRRALEVANGDGVFPCHKTVDYSGDDNGQAKENSQACVGFLVYQCNHGSPGQMVRIAGRPGMIRSEVVDDPANIDAVVRSPSEMLETKAKGGAK
jgi:hypothetical protein